MPLGTIIKEIKDKLEENRKVLDIDRNKDQSHLQPIGFEKIRLAHQIAENAASIVKEAYNEIEHKSKELSDILEEILEKELELITKYLEELQEDYLAFIDEMFTVEELD